MGARFEGADTASAKIEEYFNATQREAENAFEFKTRLHKILRATGVTKRSAGAIPTGLTDEEAPK
jgi:hypothetical protein